MPKPKISFDEFTLPFMKDPYEDIDEPAEDDGEAEDPDHGDVLEEMERVAGQHATFLGTLRSKTAGWTTWRHESHFFLMKLADDKYEWALFRIAWDDNWGVYGWECDARGSGFDGEQDAAKRLVGALFERWDIDLKSADARAHRKFLKSLGS